MKLSLVHMLTRSCSGNETEFWVVLSLKLEAGPRGIVGLHLVLYAHDIDIHCHPGYMAGMELYRVYVFDYSSVVEHRPFRAHSADNEAVGYSCK